MADQTTRLIFELLGRDNASPVFDKFGKKVQSNTRDLNLMATATKGLAVGLAGGLVAGVGAAVAGGIRLEATYSKTMAQVAVATNAPKDQLKSLDKLALKLGADTVFSAQDAGEAMLDLAKGGLTVAQIKSGALADTLTLASAGGLELSDAADDVVAALGAFHLKADQTDTAVAALAGGANASAASVSDMAQALTQAGTSAHSSHVNIQQTTAYLALLANQGIKGSDAGTSLRTMFTRLVPQTKMAKDAQKELGLSYVDSNGHLVDAIEIAKRTQKAFKGLSDEDRIRTVNAIFGSEAQRAVNAITVEGAAGLKKYLKSTTDLTQAQKLAKAANSGTSGSLESLKGTIETAEIQLGKGLAPAVQELAGDLSDMIAGADVQAWGEDLGQGLIVAGKGLKLTADAIKPVVRLVNEMPDDAKKALLLAGGIKVLSMALPSLGGNALVAEAGLIRTRVGLAGLAIQANAVRIGSGAAGLALLTYADKISTAGSATNNLLKVTGAAATGFAMTGSPWGAAIGGAAEMVAIFGKRNHAAERDVSSLTASLDTQTGALTKNSRAMVVNDLGKKVGKTGKTVFQLGVDVGVSQGMITDAALGNAKAYGTVMNGIAAVLQNEDPFSKASLEAVQLADALGIEKDSLKRSKAAWEDNNKATHDSIELNKLSTGQINKVAKATKGIPKSVVSKFTQPGYTNAVENAANLARKYHLQPKEVATALKALDYSSPQIKAVIALMKKADKTTAHPKIRVDTGNSDAIIRQMQRNINGLKGHTVGVKAASMKAGGGPIFGPGSDTSDDVPIFASNEEHMWTASEVRGAGGHGNVMRLRAAAKNGQIPALADGGRVGGGNYQTTTNRRPSAPAITEAGLARAIIAGLAGSTFRTDGRGNMRLTLNGA